jgi:hypothetical protein
VSITRASDAGKKNSRIRGRPSGPMIGAPSCTSMAPAMYQLAWLDPLASSQQPLTR